MTTHLAPTAPVDRARPSALAAWLERVRLTPKRRLRSIDAEHHGRRYRIEESAREQGAAVHLTGGLLICTGCLKAIGPTTKRLIVGPDLRVHCIGCAIEVGLLLRLPGDLVADAVEAARLAGVAWA